MYTFLLLILVIRPIPHLHHIQPLERKRSNNLCPISDRFSIQMLAIIVQGMPHGRKWTGNDMQHLHALCQERQMIIRNASPARCAIYIGQKWCWRAGLEQV